MERSMGIAAFQLFGRMAGFFTTFVNPIGLGNVKWRYLISYCCFLAFEVCFVYFFFPETHGRTLEELAFCKSSTVGFIEAHLALTSITSQYLRTRRLPMKLCMRSRNLWHITRKGQTLRARISEPRARKSN